MLGAPLLRYVFGWEASQSPRGGLPNWGYYSWHKKSIPIFEDGCFIMQMQRTLAAANRPLDFPRIYLALKRRFGPSSQLLDEWKEAFSFPFLLQCESDHRMIQYILTIASFRSSLEFRFRRQWLGMEHLDRAVIRHPFKKEFSRGEMNDCAGYFLGWRCCARTFWIFWKRDSNISLTGCARAFRKSPRNPGFASSTRQAAVVETIEAFVSNLPARK
jgi:hypothetical protein